MTSIYSFTGEYSFLSNFFPTFLVSEGITYTSLEAAYQAAKTTDVRARKAISALSAAQSKVIGRNLMLRPDWESIKLEVMERLLILKFTDPFLSEKLKDTGDVELIEGNTWGDTYWGVCNGVGENNLGKLLMKIRKQL